MREELLRPEGARRRGRDLRRGQPAAPHARRVRRPAASSRATSRSSSRRPAVGARPSTTSCSPARPASARRAWPGSSPREMGVAIHVTSGPAIERAGDLAAMLSPARRGRRALHRRDPPAPAGRRGGPLPGHGGLPDRHRARQGPGRPVDPARPAPLHPRRRHHPHRLDHRARCAIASGSSPASTTTSPSDLEAIVTRAAGILGVRVDADGAREIAGRARGTPRIANRLLRRVRDFAEVKGDGAVDLRHRLAPAWPPSASTSSASTRSTAPSSRRSASASAAARSACPRWPSASASRPRPSRTSTSRSSSRAACSCARPAGGSPPRRPSPTSASPRPATCPARTRLPACFG